MSSLDTAQTIESVAKTAAILATGIWAFFNFVVFDSPKLAHSIESNLEIESAVIENKYCLVKISFHLKNLAVSTFKVTSIDLKLWQKELPTAKITEIQFEDNSSVTERPVIWELPESSKSRFNMIMEPGQGEGYSFNVFLPINSVSRVFATLRLKSDSSEVTQEAFSDRTESVCR